MPRLGCVKLRQLPLQILLGAHPEWSHLPVAVTKEDKPASPVLYSNRKAREEGVTPGMRYAAALSLVPALQASTVSPVLLRATLRRIVEILTRYTPDVEPVAFDPEAFWLNAEGLQPLFESMQVWVAALGNSLEAGGFQAHVVIGCSRLATYVIASSTSRSIILPSAEAEQRAFASARVEVLPLSFGTRSTLRRLGVATVAAFFALPREQVIKRFGTEARMLRDFEQSRGALPVQPVKIEAPLVLVRRLDASLTDASLLMEETSVLLAKACTRAAAGGRLVSELSITLGTEEGDSITELIRPAAPTSDELTFRRLLHLRLSTVNLSAGVNRIELHPSQAAAMGAQGELFTVRAARDLDAGARAVAFLKARFGNDAVVRARLRDSHLPEERFSWDPIDSLGAHRVPQPSAAAHRRTAVRRILLTPQRHRVTRAALSDSDGPYKVSDRWWSADGEESVERDYYFMTVKSGWPQWVYFDRRARSWLIQGVVD